MAQATPILSPNLDLEHALQLVKAAGYRVTAGGGVMRAMNKRQEEAMAKLHRAVMVFAKQRAKQAVIADIRAKGQKIADFSCLQINLLAQDYFARNMEQLVDAV